MRDVIFTVKSVYQQQSCVHFNRYVWGGEMGPPMKPGGCGGGFKMPKIFKNKKKNKKNKNKKNKNKKKMDKELKNLRAIKERNQYH